MPQMTPTPCVMTIAGSDSGGGAGVQADLKTFMTLGTHGTSVLVALTAQNLLGVGAVHPVPLDFIDRQIDCLYADFDIAAVKIGMLADAARISRVAAALRRHGACNVVLDPVMVATSGARLLQADAVAALVHELLPLAAVVTPNVPEAEVLLGVSIGTHAQLRRAGAELLGRGARAALMKGGHLPASAAAVGGAAARVVDVLVQSSGTREFSHPQLQRNGHGTGCSLASAIAARLALGDDLEQACAAATDYVHRALHSAYLPVRTDPQATVVHLLDHLAGADGIAR